MKTILSTADAPAAIGPYSQAVRSGETLYCSGQLGIDPATGKLPEGVAAQTEQSLKNIRALLTAAGAASKTWSKPPCSSPTWRISRWSTRNTPKYSPRILPPVPAWRSRNCPSGGWLKSKCSPSSDSRDAPGSTNVRSKWNTVSAACGPAYVSSDLGRREGTRKREPAPRTGSLSGSSLGGIARYVPPCPARLHHALD
mgnify:CR=1 FL=1